MNSGNRKDARMRFPISKEYGRKTLFPPDFIAGQPTHHKTINYAEEHGKFFKFYKQTIRKKVNE
jgi:hypothetical protein